MNNKSLVYMILAVCVGVIILFAYNANTLFSPTEPETYLRQNEVRGMAIEYQGKLYTFNFNQQVEAINYFNRAIPVGEKIHLEDGPHKPEFTRIVIYLFNDTTIEVTPITWDGDDLVFSTPIWDQDSYLLDVSAGGLKELLSQTYDH